MRVIRAKLATAEDPAASMTCAEKNVLVIGCLFRKRAFRKTHTEFVHGQSRASGQDARNRRKVAKGRLTVHSHLLSMIVRDCFFASCGQCRRPMRFAMAWDEGAARRARRGRSMRSIA
jgi:hypothetical protein